MLLSKELNRYSIDLMASHIRFSCDLSSLFSAASATALPTPSSDWPAEFAVMACLRAF